MEEENSIYDLAVIGGGVNGCGIARDAAGRGLSVVLCEQGDLAGGTSSASTKLIHGGLRYLEYYEFRLVREALREREVLLHSAPHIVWPLRFVLPHHNGLRPAWLIRLGLFLYDNLGGRVLLQETSNINLAQDREGEVLKKKYVKGFAYSDCWVMDSRLVVLNAMDVAALRGDIRVRTQCTAAHRENGIWRLETEDTNTGKKDEIQAKVLVNATGPWLDEFLTHTSHKESCDHVRMIKGSHIVVKKVCEHDRAYIFQNADGRIVFAIPYEREYTLIGTTDVEFSGDPGSVSIDEDEIGYLCSAASEYFITPVSATDVVHSYSGVRPLFDDGESEAKAITRDYVLKLDVGELGDEAPLLSIYGGKITTYRKLAEAVLEKLMPFLPKMGKTWTENSCLPGGDFLPGEYRQLVDKLLVVCPALTRSHAFRLVRHYGSRAFFVVDKVTTKKDLGCFFGGDLYECEVTYLMKKEWARTAEDILWRRTNQGLLFSRQEVEALDAWMSKKLER